MLPGTGLQNGFQLVFGEPDLAEVGIVRLDFILESNEDEMYDGFSEIYTGEVEEYYSTQMLAGQQETVEYYDSDPIPDELSDFAEVNTSLYRVHDHIIDAVTYAELSQQQLAELKLRDRDEFIWETQQKLNVFHDSLPTISCRLKNQRETSLAHLLLVLVPNGVPVTFSENGFDQEKVETFLDSFTGLDKVRFTGFGPVSGYIPAHPSEYLWTPQSPNNIWGPLSVIAVRKNASHIVEPDWLPGLHGVIPYFRAYDWLIHRWEQLETLHSETYELSSLFGAEEESLTPGEYRDVVLEARTNWSQVNRAQDELRNFNDFNEDIPGAGMQSQIPPQEQDLSYGSGVKIGMPLLQAYEENLGQGFQKFQSDLDRVEEKQNSVLRYLQAEVSAESSIRNLSLQKRLLILTLVLTLLTLVLAAGNQFIRTSVLNAFEAGMDFLRNLLLLTDFSVLP